MKRRNNGETLTLYEKAKNKIGWGIYSAQVAVTSKFKRKKKTVKFENRRRKDAIFVYLMLLWSVVHFCIFYIGVNFNSIIMAFQRYDGTKYVFDATYNFKTLWVNLFKTEQFGVLIKNSLVSFLIVQLMSPIVLFFTFFIYKKFIGYRFFKIVLFLPTIISTVITVTIYKKFCEVAIPYVFEKLFNMQIGGLLTSTKTRYGAVMFFYMWLSFGSLMLMYLGCMNGISESIVESVKLEGANNLQEFFHITFPMIYPTFSTLFYTSIATIFTNQINLYSLWGNSAYSSVQTFGYYLYRRMVAEGEGSYTELAMLGLMMTLIAAPLTFFFKWLLNKIGPSVE